MVRISHNLVTRVFGFIDVLIRFWGQKVIGKGHNRQCPERPGEYNIFITIGANFTEIRSHVPGTGDILYYVSLGFLVKRSKVMVTTRADVVNKRCAMCINSFRSSSILFLVLSLSSVVWCVGWSLWDGHLVGI